MLSFREFETSSYCTHRDFARIVVLHASWFCTHRGFAGIVVWSKSFVWNDIIIREYNFLKGMNLSTLCILWDRERTQNAFLWTRCRFVKKVRMTMKHLQFLVGRAKMDKMRIWFKKTCAACEKVSRNRKIYDNKIIWIYKLYIFYIKITVWK